MLLFSNVSQLSGGAGGTGSSGVLSFGFGFTTDRYFTPEPNGNGGAGGTGAVFSATALFANSGAIAGGVGGVGGVGVGIDDPTGPSPNSPNKPNPIPSQSPYGAGGIGGAGGFGVAFAAGGTATNSGAITGGNGGVGGLGVSITYPGGVGGAGGDGIFAPNGLTLTNSGTITGGNGAAGGSAGTAFAGANGLGGAGIRGSGLTIDNTGGTITGGLNGDSITRANAIVLTGGSNAVGTGGIINGGVLVSGGSFAPALAGSTIGVPLAITGPLTFAPGTAYNIRVSPAASDGVAATGIATLGGANVNAAFTAGSYVQRRYAIVNAAGGVSGTFGTLANTNLPSGFRSSLSYDTNNAYLDLALIPISLNINQTDVANALTGFFNRTGGIPMIFGSLTPLGLTVASGETAVGTQQATFDASNLFLGLLTDPFNGNRDAGGTVSGGVVGYADEALSYAAKRKTSDALAAIYTKAPPPIAALLQRWSVWSAGFGGSQTTQGEFTGLGSNTTTSRIAAGAVGLDYRISPFTVAGVALAGGGTNWTVANGGSGRSDLFQAGAFVRHTVGPSYITAALAYGWQDVTTDRIAFADRLNARFTTDTLAGRVEGGYRFADPIFAAGFTPYAAGQFTTIYLPDYRETSGATNTFGLNYAAKDVTASRSEFGLRSDKSYAMQDGIVTLRGRAAWAHNFNPDRSINATFQSLPGASFVVNGASQAREAALVTASAEMKWRSGWAVAATFEGELSDVTRSYAGKGVVRYGW